MNNVEYPERAEPQLRQRCEFCPIQQQLGVLIDELKDHKDITQSEAEGLMGDEGDAFDQEFADLFSQVGLSRSEAAVLNKDFRRFVAGMLEDADSRLEVARELQEGLLATCDGPLRMRAKKEGWQYTVGICTSRQLQSMPEETVWPAHIDVSRAGE